MYPDAKHVHQLIYFYIKKKYKFTAYIANIFTGQIINFYNLLIMFFALNFTSNSKILIYLILFNITMYNIIYFKFFKFKYKKNFDRLNK